jgi:hypothetical protein
LYQIPVFLCQRAEGYLLSPIQSGCADRQKKTGSFLIMKNLPENREA